MGKGIPSRGNSTSKKQSKKVEWAGQGTMAMEKG